MATVEILEQACREIGEVFAFYRNIRSHLGIEFVATVSGSIDRIAQFPEMYAISRKKFRLAPVKPFPYVLVYKVDPQDNIEIHAFTHTARNINSLWKRLN